jgi:hypothetical protein
MYSYIIIIWNSIEYDHEETYIHENFSFFLWQLAHCIRHAGIEHIYKLEKQNKVSRKVW